MTRIVIVGAGPCGATMALMLAKRGIPVTLIEAAKNFHRVFRGEGLMPCGLDALDQMGLSDLLKQVPHRPLDAWAFRVGDRELFRVEEPMGAPQPCTLISQPPLLEALLAEAQSHPSFEFIQGFPVNKLLWQEQRVAGVGLSNGQTIPARLVIGADGRNSTVRQRADLELVKQPQTIDILWFKLPAHPRFVEENVFLGFLKGDRGFAIFHGAAPGQLHLSWVLSPNDKTDVANQDWAEIFASLSSDWLADHFRRCADAIESPLRLSVVVGRCPHWHRPGVLLLGDAAHPMSPVRAQGINVALRDVIVAANHLVPCLEGSDNRIDAALAKIQTEREPEIMHAQRLQTIEARQAELLRHNGLARSLIQTLAPVVRAILRQSWMRRQRPLRQGTTTVRLMV